MSFVFAQGASEKPKQMSLSQNSRSLVSASNRFRKICALVFFLGSFIYVRRCGRGSCWDLSSEDLRYGCGSRKNKVVGMFGRYVSPDVADRLLEQKNENLFKHVCVMFLDIRNFTRFSEKNLREKSSIISTISFRISSIS